MIANSDNTVSAARGTLDGTSKAKGIRRILPFLGPAFVASVAYVDPGNFATNIQGGAQFGYTLLWVIVASNLTAMLIQALSAKLGIATQRNLAEHCRLLFPKPVVIGLWILMEVVAMATDLAEFLGAALGFHLLFGMPMMVGGLVTAVVTFLILGLERFGFRPLEAVITSFVGGIALCYLIEIFVSKPAWGQIARHAVVPEFGGRDGVMLAVGILGATVMPHVIFLHSALMQNRIVVRNPVQLRKLFGFEIIDIVVAMGIAGLVNGAMLVMAASTFHVAGIPAVGTIEQAHITLAPLLGKAASVIFAVSLLLSGLSSSTVGTSAGQVIMQGFLDWHIPVWLRRLITMIPSLVVIALGLDPTKMLVMSQVVLSFGLPFAIVPLVLFTSSKKIMGTLESRLYTKIAGWICAVGISILNVYLIYQAIQGG